MWFAWKFVPLWYQQQLGRHVTEWSLVVICLKIRTFVVSATTFQQIINPLIELWFAWKFVPLWYQQQHIRLLDQYAVGCDLLENSYLCGISNNIIITLSLRIPLWFAWKFVPLWYQQQLWGTSGKEATRCDLLENSYLCGISNNAIFGNSRLADVVICLKIRTFVVSATTEWVRNSLTKCCDLLENSYLCGISNNHPSWSIRPLKLWFAWKFVPLWYQQQLMTYRNSYSRRCDLLENSYLCGISNNKVVKSLQ